MADLQLQPSLAQDLRSRTHLALIKRLGNLDLTKILVYRMPSLVDSAVLSMAWQWDSLNSLLLPVAEQLVALEYATWDQIVNPDELSNVDLLQYLAQAGVGTPATGSVLYAQYRALILLSTELHSIMGTPAALKKAFTGLGFPNTTIQEGQASWGGTSWPSDQGWAVFRVRVNLADAPAGTDFGNLSKKAYAIANFWKPARCWLDSIQFVWNLTDAPIPPISDSLASAFLQGDLPVPRPYDIITAPAWPMLDRKTIVPYWNNQYAHCSVTYGANEPDVAEGALVVNGRAISH